MKENKNQSNTLLWFARICGLIVSILWLYKIIGSMIEGGIQSIHNQASTGIILFLLISTLSLGVLMAWRQPLTGGKFIIVLSVLLSIFIYFTNTGNRFIPILYQGMPYFLVGLLFVQSQSSKTEVS